MNGILKLAATNVGRLLPLVVAVFFLSGCQTMPVSYSGGTVPSSRQVLLDESGERSGKYNTEDLEIDYRYSRNGSNLSISGSVKFADRLTYSFRRIENFHADIIFVDGAGKMLEARGLTTSSFSRSEDPLLFSATASIPAGAAALTFSYSGTAKSDNGGDRRGRLGGDMYFSDYPVR